MFFFLLVDSFFNFFSFLFWQCSMRLVGGGEEGEGEEFHLAKASTVPPMLLLSNTQQGETHTSFLSRGDIEGGGWRV